MKSAINNQNQDSPGAAVSVATAEHYVWGANCEGWHLVQNPGLSIIQESMPPQTAEVPHYHLRSGQFFFVLTGQLSVATPFGEHILSAEQGNEIPPGVPHHIRNKSGGVTRFLVISSPPSHDDRMIVSEINGPV